MAQTARVESDYTLTTFWDRLEEASKDVGLPSGLSDIGRELDLWPSAVQKWRDGVSLPAEKNLIALAMNRGVNTEWLKTGRGHKLAEGAMDAATRELLKIWMNLPPDAKERLLGAARYESTPKTPPPPDEQPPIQGAAFRPRIVPRDPTR